ncbi:ATP-dependent DNA helicase PcrA [Candidatus Xiphinematobacter sp. Idaho Grape]|uniref:ATP-dependent helicase n=1 Tax=Candidatus Xiphinematobacter sp. Idaho Grape TaxID=1704307 RepID=UPI000705D11B|nr:ATP-dependent helicase [Candidatus Xiphinematobacter sp. Idaho Grape]ALJ56918.1 ATP-dependent DNA helicase PcrA [Candidatus Xiphinematobacter sp. Idaho Grape]
MYPYGNAFWASLNTQQMAAVRAKAGASLVIAGAGSGKTRTLTYRVAWLLERGIPAKNILLLTFTNKAAREMLERVAALVPQRSNGIWGGTFHSVGNRILRAHAGRIGFRQEFSILDREDQQKMIASLIKEEGLRAADKRFPKAEVLSAIFSLAVNAVGSISAILERHYPYFIVLAEQIERIATLFRRRKYEANSMDFDDLLSKPLELLEGCKDIAEFYGEKFSHILVDEYQDINQLQSKFVERLAARHGNIMAVGDDAQSIYSWRGAHFKTILDFPKRHPGASIFRIETNHRSTPEILSVADIVICANKNQFKKTLAAVRPSRGNKPTLASLSTSAEQASFVTERIVGLQEKGVPLGEVAVLYRAHYHSMEVQLEFTRQAIPFSITSGLRFFEQAHIKDVLSFVKFAVNSRDELAFKRMVQLLPGVGTKSAAFLWKEAATLLRRGCNFPPLSKLKIPLKSKRTWSQLTYLLEGSNSSLSSPASLIETILLTIYGDYMKAHFPDYGTRQEDIRTLIAFAQNFENCEDFLSQLALLGAGDTASKTPLSCRPERVTLSSIHQAKGLEWRVVFLIWLAEGMFPNARSLENSEDLEEERRLFYVGITRCKDELYLSYPRSGLGGAYGEVFYSPSQFLRGIPQWIVDRL